MEGMITITRGRHFMSLLLNKATGCRFSSDILGMLANFSGAVRKILGTPLV
jgi:hypothetical protein